ncbi:Tim44/TimA family putative adaptor protein [Afifella sp. IM 167]|uniref:Tim44/TimA family putative adaptor protein n=1 Tax=Afifella sp. IM 167 TaxID=2033586 RepID=UPI001CCD132D|nr:Tim44/TimA family putative adaptor protein [Afifella sp. IM 167]MBZ8133536.1 calcium-binding protein [Afifella sp. IM 167]
MSGFFDIYSLIFLVIAVVIFMRLGSVLGRRTGNEPSPYENGRKPPRMATQTTSENVITLPRPDNVSGRDVALEPAAPDWSALKRHAKPDTPLYDGLVAISRADPAFEPDGFVNGAKAAYEMIVQAFAAGDRGTLRSLLSADVFESFSTAMTEREERGERMETSFVGFESVKLAKASLEDKVARVSVRFRSELVSVTYDGEGRVIEGDPTTVQKPDEIWTFARSVASRDPNWELVATETS